MIGTLLILFVYLLGIFTGQLLDGIVMLLDKKKR
jgi:hypothetical protein